MLEEGTNSILAYLLVESFPRILMVLQTLLSCIAVLMSSPSRSVSCLSMSVKVCCGLPGLLVPCFGVQSITFDTVSQSLLRQCPANLSHPVASLTWVSLSRIHSHTVVQTQLLTGIVSLSVFLTAKISISCQVCCSYIFSYEEIPYHNRLYRKLSQLYESFSTQLHTTTHDHLP